MRAVLASMTIAALLCGAACSGGGRSGRSAATRPNGTGSDTADATPTATPTATPDKTPTSTAASVAASTGRLATRSGGPPTSPPAQRPATSITLLFTGDMLPSDDLIARAHADAGGHGYTFAPMLRRVAPIIRRADWAICHQETPISADDAELSGWPDFDAPHALARDERAAGYDACDTASNHTLDEGAAGVTATLDSLDAAGIRHTGSARSQAEADRLTIYTVNGVRVGHLACTYGVNDHPVPSAYAVNLIDVARIRAEAAQLKRAGADIVVVSVHQGIEKDQTPSSDQLATDAQIMQSPDVDLVVGAHAHVVQPVRRLADGRWIVYGVGNFLAQQEVSPADPDPPHRDGVIIIPTFSKVGKHWRITRMGYVPTFVDAPSDVVEPAPAFSRRRTVAALTAMGAPLVDVTP